MKIHNYTINLNWTGNKGVGTKTYKDYEREYTIQAKDKAVIKGSSDPAFLGNPKLYNPEELLLASIASCHMLWYLHLCASNKIIVLEYQDQPSGKMIENKDGSGKFTEVTLYPQIRLADKTMLEKAENLHKEANKFCFIANSCNFPIRHAATYQF
ncbi:Organic hydroperoxide reductase OsmC/OhrA [Zunongwangia mangrovi]|uniref:Organic hydroperoxide reductase OsmC/OhrA n=1 Tax=Zunongwangia mangrovi TaxID=1334022 RepID=A0A1I1DZY6_9FLAO|nr:OsmC family protein [Zunongwangia mangrovi]SFB80505.1 Organic hydroperoxide reductase OsmC/OhrA [Zunongwangia mangrovi]